MLNLELLKKKREEYRNEWLRLMSLAAANEGAMQAIDDLIARFDDNAEVLSVNDLEEMIKNGSGDNPD